MDSNVFKSHIEKYARKWLSSTINIPESSGMGIDLCDSGVGIEIKCRLNRYTINHAVHEYQVRDFKANNSGKELFWAFLSYGLTKPVKKIRIDENLAKLVIDIDVKLIDWEWIKQFPISYPKTGPYVYVHSKDYPEEYFEKYEKNDGLIYFPKGSILEQKIKITVAEVLDLESSMKSRVPF